MKRKSSVWMLVFMAGLAITACCRKSLATTLSLQFFNASFQGNGTGYFNFDSTNGGGLFTNTVQNVVNTTTFIPVTVTGNTHTNGNVQSTDIFGIPASDFNSFQLQFLNFSNPKVTNNEFVTSSMGPTSFSLLGPMNGNITPELDSASYSQATISGELNSNQVIIQYPFNQLVIGGETSIYTSLSELLTINLNTNAPLTLNSQGALNSFSGDWSGSVTPLQPGNNVPEPSICVFYGAFALTLIGFVAFASRRKAFRFLGRTV